MPFLGKSPSDGIHNVLLDAITTSATATYNLTKDSVAYTPISAQSLMVSLNGVTQAPIAAYTVSGSTIVFASALTSNDVIDYIIGFEGPRQSLSVDDIGAGQITSAMIADNAITSAKIADDAVVQAAIADEAVDEARLQISNAGSNGQFLSKQSGNTGGLTWATSTPAGSIIEQLEGICDGNSITVQSGTYTLTNVTAVQNSSNSYVTMEGSSISYTPPTGATRVIYEFMVFMQDHDQDPILHFKGRVAGTDVLLSRHTWRGNGDNADYQRWIHNKMIITIGDVGSDDIANGRLQTWSSAKTLDWVWRDYSDDYEGNLHTTNHWDGSGTDILVKPTVRITAIA